MKYPKIQTLWKREEHGKRKGNILIGQYALEEIQNVNKWLVQEKIDGTNIRIRFYKEFSNPGIDGELFSRIEFHGRTDDASIPPHLLKYLQSHFKVKLLESAFDTGEEVYIFGEGYGPKIQGPGGNYRKDVGFILFDVKIGDWWLKQEDVKEIAEKLKIPYAPVIGVMSEQEIVEYVKSQPLSLCSITPHVMEGVIVRSEPLLLLRNGERLMWKLKVKDFKG